MYGGHAGWNRRYDRPQFAAALEKNDRSITPFGGPDRGRAKRKWHMPSTFRERVYRSYLEFLETAETKRRWNIFNDIPWDKLDFLKATDTVGQCVKMFCSEELYQDAEKAGFVANFRLRYEFYAGL